MSPLKMRILQVCVSRSLRTRIGLLVMIVIRLLGTVGSFTITQSNTKSNLQHLLSPSLSVSQLLSHRVPFEIQSGNSNTTTRHARNDNIWYDQKRRRLFGQSFAVASSTVSSGILGCNNHHQAANAAEVFPALLSNKLSSQSTTDDGTSSSNTELPIGLLEVRVLENVLSPPPYGMECSDILYPSWFTGSWNVVSKTESVVAPCGIMFFGGNVTYQKALDEIGTTLNYSSRFIPIGGGGGGDISDCIADRERNVRCIAQAAMGANSVLDIPVVSPNKLTALLSPIGSPSILRVDLVTLNRRQEKLSDTEFHCSEVVREIVTPMSVSGQPQISSSSSNENRLLKEIETVSLYKYNPNSDTITCRQRSASFILPSQTSMIALKMWEAAAGRPVDVRFYDVTYTRRVLNNNK